MNVPCHMIQLYSSVLLETSNKILHFTIHTGKLLVIGTNSQLNVLVDNMIYHDEEDVQFLILYESNNGLTHLSTSPMEPHKAESEDLRLDFI